MQKTRTGAGGSALRRDALSIIYIVITQYFWQKYFFFGESGLLENEPTAPAEQVHTTQRQ